MEVGSSHTQSFFCFVFLGELQYVLRTPGYSEKKKWRQGYIFLVEEELVVWGEVWVLAVWLMVAVDKIFLFNSLKTILDVHQLEKSPSWGVDRSVLKL